MTAPPTRAALPPPAVRSPRPGWHRRLTARFRDLPDHLLIGAMKGGTTQLDRLLATNPSVQPRPWKECRYLTEPAPSRTGYRALHDLRWRRLRRERATGRPERIGDASPYDLFHPRAPKVARDLVPDARFVVLLRDPVDRAWSHHRHALRHGLDSMPFEDAISQEADRLQGEEARLLNDAEATSGPHQHWSYLARGHYADQLTRWLEHFPRERFLVEFSETFFQDPVAVLGRVDEHLGLPPTPVPNPGPIANAGDDSRPSSATRARLENLFEAPNRRLAEMLGVELPWTPAVAGN